MVEETINDVQIHYFSRDEKTDFKIIFSQLTAEDQKKTLELIEKLTDLIHFCNVNASFFCKLSFVMYLNDSSETLVIRVAKTLKILNVHFAN